MLKLLQSFSLISLAIFHLATMGCSSIGNTQEHVQEPVKKVQKKEFIYQFPVTQESAQAGAGNTIEFQGNSLSLSGEGIQEGQPLRSVMVTNTDLSLIDLTDTKGKVRIISVVPSIDTRVCEEQAHYLSEKNMGLDKDVTLITVSVDTPFAQKRFARVTHMDNILFLSDFRGGQFGKTYGLFLEDPHILTRAIMVVDQNNIIRHLQITPDLGQLPDMEAAFQQARMLLNPA